MNIIQTKEINDFLSCKFGLMYTELTEQIKEIRLYDALEKTDVYFLSYKSIFLIDGYIRNCINQVMLPLEENIFHQLLMDLAIFICGKVYGGSKSTAEGIDLEFDKESTK